ncbi:MAG: hypothetical protein J6A90_08215 [Clostridia bacterium]|nr:hypothetical protein [Clostridia bacterium]
MNKNLMVDCISNIDDDIVQKYFYMRQKSKENHFKQNKLVVIKWSSIVAACLILVFVCTFIVQQYIPIKYELNYSYIGANGQEIYIPDSNVWVYYVDGTNVKKERVTLPCSTENIFITWKHLNGIGDDVELLECKITSNGNEYVTDFIGKEVVNYDQGDYFLFDITISEKLKEYDNVNYEKLILSLKKSMTEFSNIEFDEINVYFK